MRIAYLVTRSDTIGGSHIHVRDMAKAMKERGHEAVVMMGGPGPVNEHFKSFGIELEIIPSLKRNIAPLRDAKAFFELKKALAGFKPDLVSTHSSKAGLIGRMAAKSLGLPVLFTAHGWSFTEGKPGFQTALFRALERWMAPTTDKIITVSEYDRELALRTFSIPPEQIVTIHNGMVDIDASLRAAHRDQSPVHIVKIARLDDQKNHTELLDAVHGLENVHLHFVGDGPLTESIARRADELKLSDRITFWGRLDHVDAVLAKGQIFALISNWEGFPRSTLEAMRAGLPTVVSNVGGASEAVEEGKTGFVVEKGDVAGLREKLSLLIDNPGLREIMGRAARERYETYYTFDLMFWKTVEVYKEVLEEMPKSKPQIPTK